MPNTYKIVDHIVKEQGDTGSVYNVYVTTLDVNGDTNGDKVVGSLAEEVAARLDLDVAYNTLQVKPEIPSEFQTINDENKVIAYTPFQRIAFTGVYDDLTSMPGIPSAGRDIRITTNEETGESEEEFHGYNDFANVAFTGSYNDLSDIPEQFEISQEDIEAVLQDSELFNKDYNDLGLKPAVPAEFTTVENNVITRYTPFDPIAFTGDYTDLKNGPEIPEVGMEFTTAPNPDIEGETINVFSRYKAFENIAFTGDYGDLKNKPGIPEAGRNDMIEEIEGEQVVTGTTYNDFHNVAFTGNYEDLSLKPAIPDEGKIFTRTNPDDLEADPEYELTGYEDFNPIAFTGITTDILDREEVSVAIKQSAINFIDLKNLVFDTTTPSVAYYHQKQN